uniref:EF-hand domain-containing protein n=1 Tax=Ciona savignyi TaxID=51511 RepID=H2YL91_CIOSA
MLLDSEVTEKKFSVEEIRQLAAALGFPRNTLSKAIITKENEEDGISVKEFLKCCDERYFHQTLNFTFNLKSGAYNTQVLRRSIVLLANQLSFKQLEDVRVSYQMHEDYDQQGMRIDESTLIRTLKLCGLVVSPQKLMNRIRHLKATYKQKDRIQLYEFLDLLRWCELMSKQNLRYENVLSTKQSSHNVYMLDDFKEVITPRHKKILQILNERYQHQELLHEEPKLNSEKFTDHPIPPDTFEY